MEHTQSNGGQNSEKKEDLSAEEWAKREREKKAEEEKKKGDKRTVLGCGSLVVIVAIVCCILVERCDRPEVVIQGETAKVKVTLASTSVFLAVQQVGKAIYETAKENDHVRIIVVSVYMSAKVPEGLVDRYGHKVKEDELLGTFGVDDAEEVRKYADADSYIRWESRLSQG